MRYAVLSRVTKADILPLLLEWKKQKLTKAKAISELKKWLKVNRGEGIGGVFESLVDEVYSKPSQAGTDNKMPKALLEKLPAIAKTTPVKLSPKLLNVMSAKIEEIRNKNKEHLYFFDIETGKIVAYITSNDKRSVSIDPATAKAIEKYGSTRLATLHNHPINKKKGYAPESFSYLHGKDMIYLHQFPLNVVCSKNHISWAYTTDSSKLKSYSDSVSGINALMSGGGSDDIETYIWDEIYKLQDAKVLVPKYYLNYWIPTINTLAHNWWAANAKKLKVKYWRT